MFLDVSNMPRTSILFFYLSNGCASNVSRMSNASCRIYTHKHTHTHTETLLVRLKLWVLKSISVKQRTMQGPNNRLFIYILQPPNYEM